MGVRLILLIFLSIPLNPVTRVDYVEFRIPAKNMKYDVTAFRFDRKLVVDIYGYPDIQTGLWRIENQGVESIEIKRFRTEKITRIIISTESPFKIERKFVDEKGNLVLRLRLDFVEKVKPPKVIVKKVKEKVREIVKKKNEEKRDTIWYKFKDITTKDLYDFVSFVSGKKYNYGERKNRIHTDEGVVSDFDELIRGIKNGKR